MEPKNKNMCLLPWLHIFADSKGDLIPCCLYREQKGEKSFNLHKNGDLKKYWSSEKLKSLRQQFLASERPKGCQACFEHEEAGILSYRQGQNQLLESAIERTTDFSTDPPYQPVSFDLRLGNICNLKCNMCGPHSSKLILKDLLKEDPTRAHLEEFKNYMNINWFEKEEIWNELLSSQGQIVQLHLTGGEPLIMPEVEILLQMLIKKNLANQIILSFNSNVTTLRGSTTKLFKSFKGVKIHASIDAIGELSEFIRYPSNWDQVKKNIKELASKRSQYNIIEFQIHSTIQNENIFHLPTLLEFIETQDYLSFDEFNFFPLEGPPWHNIRFLPKSIKDQVQKKYSLSKVGKNILHSILRIMEQGKEDPKMFKQFKDLTLKRCSERGFNWNELAPEYKDFFNCLD